MAPQKERIVFQPSIFRGKMSLYLLLEKREWNFPLQSPKSSQKKIKKDSVFDTTFRPPFLFRFAKGDRIPFRILVLLYGPSSLVPGSSNLQLASQVTGTSGWGKCCQKCHRGVIPCVPNKCAKSSIVIQHTSSKVQQNNHHHHHPASIIYHPRLQSMYESGKR